MSENTGTLIHNGNKDRKYDLRFGSHVKFNKLLEYQNSFGLVVEDLIDVEMVIKVATRAYGSQKVLHVLISNTQILKATG